MNKTNTAQLDRSRNLYMGRKPRMSHPCERLAALWVSIRTVRALDRYLLPSSSSVSLLDLDVVEDTMPPTETEKLTVVEVKQHDLDAIGYEMPVFDIATGPAATMSPTAQSWSKVSSPARYRCKTPLNAHYRTPCIPRSQATWYKWRIDSSLRVPRSGSRLDRQVSRSSTAQCCNHCGTNLAASSLRSRRFAHGTSWWPWSPERLH